MVKNCTRCELRFASEAELMEHLGIDHDADVSILEPLRYRGAHEDAPLYPDFVEPDAGRHRRCLVVANQTLGSSALTEEVRRRLQAGPVDFVVVVPATHSADYPTAPAERQTEDPSLRPEPDEPGTAQARWRLRKTVEALRDAGAVVTGLLGPPDPYEAAGALLAQEPFDEVIISTLSPERSRWLALDVPRRIRRMFGVPVTEVTAGAPTSAAAANDS